MQGNFLAGFEDSNMDIFEAREGSFFCLSSRSNGTARRFPQFPPEDIDRMLPNLDH